MQPLVTVICVCYNHQPFVREAIESVFRQTYTSIQLVVVDDASPDGSVEEIRKLQSQYSFEFIELTTNHGYCQAFNAAWRLAKGDFIIDLAADDILLPTRVEEGVHVLVEKGSQFGVNFSDAEYVDAGGKHIRYHSDRFPHPSVPQGDVYKEVIQRYFICSPTMMIRQTVLREMNGFDESLAYEDFDLWVRASRNYLFCYTPKVLVKRRTLSNSLGRQQFKRSSKQLASTYQVCEKIYFLNRNVEERRALRKRLLYELRICLQLIELNLAWRYVKLLATVG